MVKELVPEEIRLMEEYLNLKSAQVQRAKEVAVKQRLNNKYMGAVKLINKLNGQVKYLCTNTHKIELYTLPGTIDLSSFNIVEQIGCIELLLNAGLQSSIIDNFLNIKF